MFKPDVPIEGCCMCCLAADVDALVSSSIYQPLEVACFKAQKLLCLPVFSGCQFAVATSATAAGLLFG